jgi:hypothetical protein
LSQVILLTGFCGDALDRLRQAFGDTAECHVVNTLDGLRALSIADDTTLIGFGTGVIVPRDILGALRRPAYNVHAASPEFPGRDPHHHAVYRRARRYGATLHMMDDKVDAGQIVGVDMFDVLPDTGPHVLLEQANEAGMRLIERFGRRLVEEHPLPPLAGVRWGQIKTSRRDLLTMAELSPLISAEEFERRYRAFDGGVHDNLTFQLHGRTFRIDKTRDAAVTDQSGFADFTEAGYRQLLLALKERGYSFARYGEPPAGKHVLWRHDVDVSMHRAARLAAIEAQEGAFATYFVNPQCSFYSLLEPDVLRQCHAIARMGHEIGLHFDGGAHAIDRWQRSQLEVAVARAQSLLETIVGTPVRSVSWHNPDQSNLLDFDDETIAGLHNAYAGGLRRAYTYCSDSNGYWRFRPMAEVIAEEHERLHLLTHPEWWTPEPMAPSDRIDRAIRGRAIRTRQDYDDLLARAGRINLRGQGPLHSL